MTIQEVIFYLLLIDCLSANLFVWFDEKWYYKHLRIFSRFVAPAKGWGVFYLALVLWIGWLLYTTGKLTLIGQ